MLAALMLLALDAAGHGGPIPSLRQEMLLAAARQAQRPTGPASSIPAPREGAPAEAPPPCLGDVCQPQVSVPGYAPAYSMRGSRTRLTLEALDRLRIEPVSTVAWWLVTTGVRFDYTPAAVDSALSGGTGVARGQITLAWRIDAWGSPTFAERER